MSEIASTPLPLERIRAQHLELKRRMAQLRDTFEGPALAGRQRVQVEEQLASFDAALNLHFAQEEDGGYFSDVLAVAPRLSRRATKLEQAHAGLRRQVAELRARVADTATAWDDLQDRFRLLFGELRSHEVAEDDLVHEAFKRDLGSD